MNCCECEELIAAASRDGRTLEAAAEHLAGCGACWEFANEAASIASALAKWHAPRPPGRAVDATRAALLNRVAIRSRAKTAWWRKAPAFMTRQPALLAVPATAAATVGLSLLPEWARVAAACWAGVSTALVTLILLSHAQPTASEGDWR